MQIMTTWDRYTKDPIQRWPTIGSKMLILVPKLLPTLERKKQTKCRFVLKTNRQGGRNSIELRDVRKARRAMPAPRAMIAKNTYLLHDDTHADTKVIFRSFLISGGWRHRGSAGIVVVALEASKKGAVAMNLQAPRALRRVSGRGVAGRRER